MEKSENVNSGVDKDVENFIVEDIHEDETLIVIEPEKSINEPPPMKSYNPRIPYPQRLERKHFNDEFVKFLEVMRGLEVYIPFFQAMAQMLIYAKLLKELLSNKSKLEESSTIALSVEDVCKPNVTLHCKKLNFEFFKPTRRVIQLADRSVKVPIGEFEDGPVQVGRVFIPCDFVAMEMEEDSQIPLIFGRPFLKKVGVLVDMKRDVLTLRVEDEKMKF
ncbi:uncharacterized protein LOC125496626 [Beta vulgaris subsp. vulgaris]|uniref:uncharacterized protein LOC125496626 n=1 Tax=Beta vulgaris subsp. vulgaris TaxID=3555 RepID=UPI0020371649|nr:uncharacterized protein LOC125496626 [Beta vulgaris subsp. vulgaris]